MRTLDKLERIQQIIGSYPNATVSGRTRMQKTIYLLQRVGLSTGYEFAMHMYGPYSEELTTDLEIGCSAGFLTETRGNTGDGLPAYTFSTEPDVPTDLLPKRVQKILPILQNTDPIILELAATYDAIRQKGKSEEVALEMLQIKKGEKCENGRADTAIALLRTIGIEK